MSYDDRFDDSYDDYAYALLDDRDLGGESFGREYLHLQPWFDANFSTHEALALLNAGITLEEAIGFREMGIDLARAQMLVEAGYGPDNLSVESDGTWLLGDRSLPSLSGSGGVDLMDLRKAVAEAPPGPRPRRSRRPAEGQMELFAGE